MCGRLREMPASGRGDGRRRLLSRKPRAAIRPMAARGSLRFALPRCGARKTRLRDVANPTPTHALLNQVTVIHERLAATGCRGKLRVRGPGPLTRRQYPWRTGIIRVQKARWRHRSQKTGPLNAIVLEECCAGARVRCAAASGVLGIVSGGTHVDCHDPGCACPQHRCDAGSRPQADAPGRHRPAF